MCSELKGEVVIKDCQKCGKTYGGSWAGAMFQQARPGNKVGYFGGYCECGAKLTESYVYHGFLRNFKKVHRSEEKKFEDSLTDKEFMETFGGKRGRTMNRFTYSETFIAKDRRQAIKKIYRLWCQMKKDVKGRARLVRGYLNTDGKDLYSAHYDLVTAGFHESVVRYLEIKRQPLGVHKYKF